MGPTFDQLVAEYDGAIDRLCAGYERDGGRREELRQEIWLGVWKSLASFRQDASARTWVYRIAHNIATSHVRRRVRDRAQTVEPTDPKLDVEPDSDRSPERQLATEQRWNRLRAAIGQLPLIDRQIVLLSLEDLSQHEIADITGISKDNVSTRLHRAKERLMKLVRANPGARG